MATKSLKAVVLGATGAVGEEILGQLLVNPAWGEVVVIGRREAPVPPAYTGWPPSKLTQKVLDLDKLEEEGADVLKGADSVFCALGTTRSAAGSAEAFQKVDLGYVKSAAHAAKAAAVSHFALVSATGANPNVWATTWSIGHPLLYTKTKGLAEEAVKAEGFNYVSIARPGLLERGTKARLPEKIFQHAMASVAVSQVAKVLVEDATAYHTGKATSKEPVRVFENKEVKNWGKI